MNSASNGSLADRRTRPRAAIEARATVHLVNQEFKCVTRDLSTEGLALSGKVGTPPTGTFVRVLFKLPNIGLPVDVDGILVRTEPHDADTTWGLKFLEPSPNVIEQIDSYLDSQGIDHLPPYTPIPRTEAPSAIPALTSEPSDTSGQRQSPGAESATALDGALLGFPEQTPPESASKMADPGPLPTSIPLAPPGPARTEATEQDPQVLGFYEESMSQVARKSARSFESGSVKEQETDSVEATQAESSSEKSTVAELNGTLRQLYKAAEAEISGDSAKPEKKSGYRLFRRHDKNEKKADHSLLHGHGMKASAKKSAEPSQDQDLQTFYEQAMSKKARRGASQSKGSKKNKP